MCNRAVIYSENVQTGQLKSRLFYQHPSIRGGFLCLYACVRVLSSLHFMLLADYNVALN